MSQLLHVPVGAKIYISGPMSGYPDNNFPAFDAAALRLTALGYSAVNPADINKQMNPDDVGLYSKCIRNDLKALADCDAIYMLNGWQKSVGAKLELENALTIRIPVFFEPEAKLP